MTTERRNPRHAATVLDGLDIFKLNDERNAETLWRMTGQSVAGMGKHVGEVR